MTLEWILGRCDSLRAEVYLRATLAPDVDANAARLTGTLSGPACRRAITLPVTAKFAPASVDSRVPQAGTVVARTILTEPSYWTPDLPNLYRIDATLVSNGHAVSAWQSSVGLRRLGIRGRSLWLDGRRYVPRGLMIPEASVDLDRFREASVAAVVADPGDAFLERCDIEGVAVVALLADHDGTPLDAAAAVERITRWAWHPAVLMAMVPAAADDDAVANVAAVPNSTRGTLLLAREVDGAVPPPELTQGVDAFVVSLAADASPHPAWRAAPVPVPVVARRTGSPSRIDAVPSRRACDSLQAALARWGTDGGPGQIAHDWAGYLVDAW